MHKLTPYDPANALVDDEEIAVFIADALETGDSTYIAKALGVVARAKGMSNISQQTGLSREQLYRFWANAQTRRGLILIPLVIFIRLFHHAVGHRTEQRVEALHITQQPQVE